MTDSEVRKPYKWCLSEVQCSCPEWLRPFETREKLQIVSVNNGNTWSVQNCDRATVQNGQIGEYFGKSCTCVVDIAVVQVQSDLSFAPFLRKGLRIDPFDAQYLLFERKLIKKYSKRKIKSKRRICKYVDFYTTTSSPECAFPCYGCCEVSSWTQSVTNVYLTPDHYLRMRDCKATLHAELLAWHWSPERIGKLAS